MFACCDGSLHRHESADYKTCPTSYTYSSIVHISHYHTIIQYKTPLTLYEVIAVRVRHRDADRAWVSFAEGGVLYTKISTTPPEFLIFVRSSALFRLFSSYILQGSCSAVFMSTIINSTSMYVEQKILAT